MAQNTFLNQLFGFKLKRKPSDEIQIPSVIAPTVHDGSVIVNNAAGSGGHYGLTLDIEGQVKNENDMIRRYREISKNQDVDDAINNIINDAIIIDGNDKPIELQLDNVKIGNNIKKRFQEEFARLLNLTNFNFNGHDIFRQWYIDGRLYAHILFEKDNTKQGIAEIRFIDPRKIRKIKKINKSRNDQGIEVVVSIEEYYIYNENGITETNVQGVKMSLDSVVFCTSGLIDGNTGAVIGYLDKAIKPANQLRMIEDAIIIYRITRAPERRIFYVDVGNLPKLKAEQYVNEMMNKFKNKLVYDAHTGELSDNKRHVSMMEDFWMPRREGGKGTEITTLPGGTGLNQLDDLEYFKKKLLMALNVPAARAKEETGFSVGVSQTITRDEIKFHKFINKLRTKFSAIYTDMLKIQLVSTGVLSLSDWDEIKNDVMFKFTEDNHYSELKDIEIMQSKLGALQLIDPFAGKYYSKKWIQKNVLMLDDEEIEDIQSEIEDELKYAQENAVPMDGEGNPTNPDQDQSFEDMEAVNTADRTQEAHAQDMRHKEEKHSEEMRVSKLQKGAKK